jgi:hypothetical protein
MSFSTEELYSAKRQAVRHYNSLGPIGVDLNQDYISDPHIFLLGVCYYLYLTKRLNLARNFVVVEAGGMQTSISKARLDLYGEIIQTMRAEFEAKASVYKKNLNIEGFYGRIG